MVDHERNPQGSEDRSDDPRRNRARYAALSDRALLDAMRAHDALAIEEFMRRFRCLAIVHAKRLRIPSYERAGWVTDLLYEVVISLCRKDAAMPRALGPYLVTTFRRKAYASRRQQLVRERLELAEADDVGGTGQRALLSTCSEAAVRASRGPDWEPNPLPLVLERLVSAMDEGVSEDERLLLRWIARRMPYSLIGTWLGITRSAAVKRVTRLRARLLEATLRFGGTLDLRDRVELARFLRRTQVFE